MGSGKTSWAIQELLAHEEHKSFLYVTPFLDEVSRIKENSPKKMYEPKNTGAGKLSNLSKLLESGVDIAATHELFRRFDEKCKQALKSNEYVLILDESMDVVEPYHFQGKDDYLYLLQKGDIKVDGNGLVHWTGRNDLDTRFDDVRLLAQNKSLFVVDGKFFLWHYPAEIFKLFSKIYIMTYNFCGTLMYYYFKLYGIQFETKSIKLIAGNYQLTEWNQPDKSEIQKRLQIYRGSMNTNIGTKDNVLSASWCRSQYHAKDRKTLKNNLFNFSHNIAKARGNDIIWTCFKDVKKELSGKGYAKRHLPCNARAVNNFMDSTCLMYCANIYVNPEILKFFERNNITINQDEIALNTLIQWIWRGNLRDSLSTKVISLYLPSARMRRILDAWLAA